MRAIAPTSTTYTEMTGRREVTIDVHAVSGGIMRMPFGYVPAPEWLRKPVAEEVRIGRGHAQEAPDNVKLLKNGSYVVAGHRPVSFTTATTVSPATPRLAEDEHFGKERSKLRFCCCAGVCIASLFPTRPRSW